MVTNCYSAISLWLQFEGQVLFLSQGSHKHLYGYAMSLFSDDNLEEILLRTDDYPSPSPTEASSGLDINVSSMTPSFSQADLATTYVMEARGTLQRCMS